MSLLQALGLQKPAAGWSLDGPEAAGGGTPAAPASKPAKTAQASQTPKTQPTAVPIEELAKWPSKAHRAWKRLDHVQQSAVAVQMASRYGSAFAKAFVEAAKSGKTRLEGADFVTALPSQTPDAMKAKGFKLAQRASTSDRAQEWWVRPDGFEVFLLRELKNSAPTKQPSNVPPTKDGPPIKDPPIEPPGTCSEASLEQLNMALGWAKAALDEAEQAEEEIKEEQARQLKMNVTSQDFEDAYTALTQRFKDQIEHLRNTIDDLENTKTALAKSGCDLSKLNQSIDDLEDKVTGFEAEQDLHENDIRKPLRVKPKDMPDDSGG